MSQSTPATPDLELKKLLSPLLARVAELAPATRTTGAQVAELEAVLEQEFPYAGEVVQAIGPVIGFFAGDELHEVAPYQAGKFTGFLHQAVGIEVGGGYHAFHGPFVSGAAYQGACVDVLYAH